ncbi:MAG: CHAD domain-containing protein [Gammaproteobacteria bacterium]|nr:CHAD domain-containing protein [Gammaproteobacteria bacterium]
MLPSAICEPPHAVTELLELLATQEQAPRDLDAETVHRIRVAIKQVRAWLKLCRAVTGETESNERLVAKLRALSGELAARRDRDVAVQTLHRLLRKYPGKKAQHAVEILARMLVEAPAAEAERITAAMDYAAMREDLQAFSRQAISPEDRDRVIARRFGKMCKLGDAALASEDCGELHAWRKQVKTLAYQLAMAGAGNANTKKLADRLTRLGGKLGDIHDLCFLQGMIDATSARQDSKLDMQPLRKRIARERKRLLQTVRTLFRHVRR